MRRRIFVILSLMTLALAAGVVWAQSKTVKGVEVSVAGIERTSNLSLADCPAGANIVRGVIRPGDDNEFAAVKVDFKTAADFKTGTTLGKPTVQDVDGKTYNTAQSFAEIPASQSFSCTFAFRVPKGTKLKAFVIDTLTIDVSKIAR
jgi:hypothetical protein